MFVEGVSYRRTLKDTGKYCPYGEGHDNTYPRPTCQIEPAADEDLNIEQQNTDFRYANTDLVQDLSIKIELGPASDVFPSGKGQVFP